MEVCVIGNDAGRVNATPNGREPCGFVDKNPTVYQWTTEGYAVGINYKRAGAYATCRLAERGRTLFSLFFFLPHAGPPFVGLQPRLFNGQCEVARADAGRAVCAYLLCYR